MLTKTLLNLQYLAQRLRISETEDDRGAVTTETAIITAIVAIAAFGLATLIAAIVGGWQAQIPTAG